MKIALCSSAAPFVQGGYRNIVEWLAPMLERQGHQVEIVYLPEVDSPDVLIQQMMAFRWVDLEAADRIICFRPQAHLIPHPHKVLWFIHHIRGFYDLWDTEYRGFPDDAEHRAIRDVLHQADDQALREARQVFVNSRVVGERLSRFNGVASEVLYPPVHQPERFYMSGFNDEIVCICRVEHHKRQHLLVEALKLTKTPVRLRLAGVSAGEQYPKALAARVAELNLGDRVVLDDRWIEEEEKVALLAECLAAAYMPLDEDSYGYPSMEASLASKPILTASDSGGVLELVEHGVNGYVADPNPQSIAEAMDRLYIDRDSTAQMGRQALARLGELDISWDHVIDRLLA